MRTSIVCFLVSMFVLSGCGGSSSDSGASNPDSPVGQKALFSKWMRTDGLVTLDLTAGTFSGPFTATATFSAGGQCKMTVTLQGNVASTIGTASISSSFVQGSASSDPGCASYSGDVGFDEENSVLVVCGADCMSYN